MLRFQWKLLWSSNIRKILFLTLVLCCLWIHFRILYEYIQGIHFSAIYNINSAAELFIYYFIILLFLAYDYFREVVDADMVETVQSSTRILQHDLLQFCVMLMIVVGYAVVFVSLNVISGTYAGVVTGQLFVFFVKEALIYVICNGLIAILLAWLLSRTVGKILGYVIMILFSSLVSPIMHHELEFYVLWARGIFNWFRALLIMPQGLETLDYYVLFPVNLTIASRSIFWIGFFVSLLTMYYYYKIKSNLKNISLFVGILTTTWALIYSALPASFYSNNNSLGSQDSYYYDQWSYMIEERIQQESSEIPFEIDAYDMKLKLTRFMEADVTIYPNDSNLEYYDMTLYHLYTIQSVTDANGNELECYRNGDYLTIHNPNELNAIHIRYKGGCANFYSNSTQVNLPGWFPYYPIPGFHTIYQDYQYEDNTLAKEARFDVEIQAIGTIYSDLELVERNHFQGVSTGPTFLAGFVKEEILPGEVRYVYPYLEIYNTPNYCYRYARSDSDYERSQVEYEYVIDKLMQEDNTIETIIITPNMSGDTCAIYDGTKIIDFVNWHSLQCSYEETGEFSLKYLEQYETTEEDMIGVFLSLYKDFKDTFETEQLYDYTLDCFLQQLGDFGYTEEDFKSFFIEHLGEEEWKYLEECRDYVED